MPCRRSVYPTRQSYGQFVRRSVVEQVAHEDGGKEASMPKSETLDRLRRFLVHAPGATPCVPGAPVAWWSDDGVVLCAGCAGRIMDRGCRIGESPLPIWEGSFHCDLCGVDGGA